MGKKSKRNKNNNGGRSVSTAASSATNIDIYRTVCRLLEAHKYGEILKVESKYHHLDTFSDNPAELALVLYPFGYAIHADSKDEICLLRKSQRAHGGRRHR